LPESRHRKINRARKRPRVASARPTTANVSSPGISQRTKLIVVVATAVIAAVAAFYYFANRRSSDVVYETTTASGLKIHDVRVGDGASPQPGQSVKVNYIGWLENGKEFENSYKLGKPATFKLGRLIPGWDEGLSTMKVGGERMLYIPSNLAYGPAGSPPNIPPNSNLKFKIELLDVK
jgi:FKBP-type peptidyl-prolyl cis-trans isomerase